MKDCQDPVIYYRGICYVAGTVQLRCMLEMRPRAKTQTHTDRIRFYGKLEIIHDGELYVVVEGLRLAGLVI